MNKSSRQSNGRKNGGAACIRLLIADGQPRALQSLKALLTALCWSTLCQAGRPFEVIGETDSGKQTIDQVQTLRPDVVVMDMYDRKAPLSEPEMAGLKTIRTIKSQWPAIRVVVLTMYATDRFSALSAGADVFLLKGCSTSELLEAIVPVAC